MGPGGERERKKEEVSAGCAPRVPTAHAAPSLADAGLRGDPTPPPTQPFPRGKLRAAGLLDPLLRARTKLELPGPCLHPAGRGGQAWLGMWGTGGNWVAACGAVRLHVEEVLDALRADRALALVLLGDRFLLGPGEMHLLRCRLHLVTRGLGAAGEGGGVFVMDKLDLQRGEWDRGQGPGPAACLSPILAQPLTSSSGFSSPSPTCSSGTLRRRRVLAGFLRRMEPRDSSVMLWICVGQGQPGERGRGGLGWADPSLQPWLPSRMSA